MQISFENPDKVNGLLTMTVEEKDFKDDVEKTLKDYRKRANVPGFRPGQVPMGLIKRQFGTSVKVDAINKLIGEQLQKYINDNKTDIVTWKAGILLADAAGNNTMRVKAIRSTLRTIKAMRDATGRQIYLNVLSRLTRFPAETLSKEMENL